MERLNYSYGTSSRNKLCQTIKEELGGKFYDLMYSKKMQKRAKDKKTIEAIKK